ncbi:MAG: histidine kinase, partial [Myxococcales bacterium]|nr:histidine kinase [Myxococcales bacterium]
LDETRRSVRDLRVAPLEHGRLAPALERLGRQAQLTHGIAVEVNVAAGQRPLPRRVADALYRMAQETLSNAGRHAEAKRVQLTLIAAADSVRLRVEDDGCGFEAASTERATAFGLLGIEERVQQLGGALEISSEPGAGTRVEIEIPLRHAEATR